MDHEAGNRFFFLRRQMVSGGGGELESLLTKRRVWRVYPHGRGGGAHFFHH